MGNSKVLQKATKELTKAKAPSKQRDIIYDPMGQWKHPGENTRIPGNNITMQGVPYPVYAQPNIGQPQMMYPGQDYVFPEADYVDEYPQMKRGGLKKSKYSKSIMAINKLFAKHDLFKKPGKHKIYDPNAKEYAEGGITEDMLGVINPEDLDPETLKKYLKQLKTLENSVKSGYRKGKWYPHRSFEGGTDTIAYGHKLTAGEDYSKGITEAEASELQKQDVLDKQKVAETFVDKKYGKGTFDKLPQDSQMLLVDYTYNGVINQFPSFVKHVVNSDKKGMLKEYERGSKGSPLKARNEWTADVIENMNFKKSKKATKKKSKESNESSTPSYFPVVSKMTPFEYGGDLQQAEYGMPLGAGVAQNFIGNRDEFNVGGIPNLPLRDNRVNYNAYTNGFEPMTKKQYGGDYIETDLTDDEIQAYRDGGYVVEDISVPSLNQFTDGGEKNYYTVKGSNAVYRKVNGKWEVDTNKSGNFQPLSKGDVKKRTEQLNKNAEQYFDANYDDLIKSKKAEYKEAPKNESKPKSSSNSSGAQKAFKEDFKVTKKSNLEKANDEIEKGVDDFIKYHNENSKQPLSKEDIENARQNISQNVWASEGVYNPAAGENINNVSTISNEDDKHIIKTAFPENASASDYAQRGWEYLTNPGTAAEYLLGNRSGSMPFNINELKGQGVNVDSDRNVVGQALNMINPLDDAQSVLQGVNDITKGNKSGYATAGFGLLGFLPGGDYLKGLKKSAKIDDELVDLWRIQEKGDRPMSELAAEGKLGPMFKNEKAIQHFKDREKYFGQWFTKDKADLDWYKKDREFKDPEIINLKVPKNKLEEFQNYDKTLSRASDREFVIPNEQQNLYRVSDAVKTGQKINNNIQNTVEFSGPLKHKFEDVPEVLNALRQRGKYWDNAGAKSEDLLHPDMVNYHGTFAGRPLVEVKMPDGSSEMFYKSSGWAGKKGNAANGTTEGMWQVFGGHADTPTTSKWFIKDKDYQNYYGSNTFGSMANNMDNALMKKYNFNNVDELENAFNFQNRFGNTDSYTPKKKGGNINNFIELELSPDEIKAYKEGGWVVEYVD